MDKNYFFRLALVLSFTLCANVLSAQDPAQEGAWSDPIAFDLVPVAVANLPDGRLVTWSSKHMTDFGGGDGATYTQIFDPAIGSGGAALPMTLTQTDHDMFCPGINNLVDGRILVSGGSSSGKTSIYDPVTEIWSPADDLNVPRGYQAAVTLPNGAIFTLGGSWSGGIGGKFGEIYSLATGWVPMPSIEGELLLDGNDPDLDEPVPSQKAYRSDNHAWLWAAPNGKIFHAGPGTDMHWIDVRDVDSPTVVNLGRRGDDTYAMNGTTVMFDVGKLLKVGGSRSYAGGTPASDKTYVIDINNETPVVTPAPGFKNARTMNNSVVLPNGKVLVVGGLDSAGIFSDAGARYVGEIYDPSTNTWEDTAPMQVPRTYHSVAILMSDARIFIGGGGLCGPCDVNHLNAEIYSPPYLFNDSGTLATRPTIQAPESADYNSTISVTGSSEIKSFSLVRFSSATHSTNNEQRRIPVGFVETPNGYDINIPDRNLLPPGYYMLFGLDKLDVPSVAENIQIGGNVPLVIVDSIPFKINEIEKMVDAYAPDNQDNGTFEVQDDGNTLKLMGNAWKKAPLDYTITPNTVVSFDFRVTGMGEIHGIGFDDDNSLDNGWAQRFFALAGTQTYGIQEYRTYTGNDWSSFSIPIGEFFTGDFNFLVFSGDKDNEGASQESFFRNIKFSEDGAQSGACASSSAVVISATSTNRIEAEDFCEKHGNIRTEVSSDGGRGLNLGFIRNGDWLDYRINVPENGDYLINYRVGSHWNDGGKISMMVNDELLGTVDVSTTSVWSSYYSTVSDTISLSAGIQNIRVYATQWGRWSLNWFELELLQASTASSKARLQDFENGKWVVGESDDIIVSPNPSKGVLDLYLGKMMNVSTKVSIYNTVGKEVYSTSYDKDHQDGETMNLSFLANGVYQIIVKAGDNTYHKSVVIQK